MVGKWEGGGVLDGSQLLGGFLLSLFLFVLKLIAKELCRSLQDLLLQPFKLPLRKGIG
jgi:hypothetical protein